MKRLYRGSALLLLVATLLSGCSMFTKQGRQERAYERYVRKSSLGRVKQQKRMSFKRSKMPIMQPTEPAEATTVSGPEAVSSGDGSY